MSALPIIRKFDVPSQEVVLFKARVNYTEITLASGELMVVSIPLKEIESRIQSLPSHTFFRTHKSYIINRDYVESFSYNGTLEVRLANQTTACISRRRKEAFIHYMKHPRPQA